MRILLTGGTGLIGQALCKHWAARGHELLVWSRQPHAVPARCSGARGIARLEELQGDLPLDAVINLAGAPIADRRWSATRRHVLWRSRVHLTRQLVRWLGAQPQKPEVLVSGSAVGWYGNRGDEPIDERSAAGTGDFASRLCVAWERQAEAATQHGMRVVLVRTAPVLASEGGMLPRLLLPFGLGLGARLGDGQQWMPWIHLDDEVGLIDHLLHRRDCHGAFNACAPEAVKNAAFTETLAHCLRRPAILSAPRWVLRNALGDMSILLLGGQRAIPRRSREHGYAFRHPALAEALKDLLMRH